MAMTMPKVMDCNETDCAYNLRKKCHALAITVGGEEECPMCDTEIKAVKKGGVIDAIGGVGACKVDDCLHNQDWECTAKGIHVQSHSDHAECITFRSR